MYIGKNIPFPIGIPMGDPPLPMGVHRDQPLRNAPTRFGGTLGEIGRGHEEQRSDVGGRLWFNKKPGKNDVFFVKKQYGRFFLTIYEFF